VSAFRQLARIDGRHNGCLYHLCTVIHRYGATRALMGANRCQICLQRIGQSFRSGLAAPGDFALLQAFQGAIPRLINFTQHYVAVFIILWGPNPPPATINAGGLTLTCRIALVRRKYSRGLDLVCISNIRFYFRISTNRRFRLEDLSELSLLTESSTRSIAYSLSN
jgi:hypothetical protein